MKISIPVDLTTIVKQLPMREKLQLVRQLEQETWGAQLDKIVTRIRARRAVKKLSMAEIDHIVKEVRDRR